MDPNMMVSGMMDGLIGILYGFAAFIQWFGQFAAWIVKVLS